MDPTKHSIGRGRGRGSILASGIGGPSTSSQDSQNVRSIGRGRGKVSKDYLVEEDAPTSVPFRPREDPVPDDDSDDDDFIKGFRKLHANNQNVPSTSAVGRGRGIGRGRGSLSYDILDRYPIEPGMILNRENVRIPLPIPSPTTSASSKTSAEETSSSDYSEIAEKPVIVMKGKQGNEINVVTNFIKLNLTQKDMGLFEYHVYFEPMVDSKRLRYFIMKNIVDAEIKEALNFDGAKLYLPVKLPDKYTEFMVPHPNDPNTIINVGIKFVKQTSLDDCVHFFNVLMRRVMLKLGLIEMNRNFFNYNKVFDDPVNKLQIWPGFVTAVDVYEGGLMLCCDSSFKVLRTETMLDRLENLERMDPYNFRDKFKDYALGKIVLTKYNNKNYRIDDIDWDSNPRSTFMQTRGGQEVEVSFSDYYKINYKGLQIKNLGQPMLVTRAKEKRLHQAHDFSRPINILLVPELCYVTGMTEDITSDYRIMKVIADQTRVPPASRHKALMDFIANVNGTPEARQILSDWGLELDSGTVCLPGRMILPPTITYNKNTEIKAQRGDFSKDLLRNHILEPIAVIDWLLIYHPRDNDKASRLVQIYRAVAPPLGILYRGEPKMVQVGQRATPEDYRNALVNNITKATQFVVVIIPTARDDLYRMIKLICYREIPISSQVILSKTLTDERKLRSVMQKVALQINCKMGGALWTIRIPLPEKIMFIGMDVYHDPKRKNQSVTGFVATLNPLHTKFYSRVIFQSTQQENISSLRPVIKEAMTSFYDENNAFPDRIIVFRDGVGDGQLELTKQHEVSQMTETFSGLGILPKFTFCVVQKRINARLFVDTGSYIINPEPGTVMDHTITRRYHFDFFLVSQLIRQGTVNPTHYIVLTDNSEIKPDTMQKFAYATSYMYYNWPGSIRVPAMCQYAHKLAGLVGQHLRTEPSLELSKKLYYL